jgi:hypothetical protein
MVVGQGREEGRMARQSASQPRLCATGRESTFVAWNIRYLPSVECEGRMAVPSKLPSLTYRALGASPFRPGNEFQSRRSRTHFLSRARLGVFCSHHARRERIAPGFKLAG